MLIGRGRGVGGRFTRETGMPVKQLIRVARKKNRPRVGDDEYLSGLKGRKLGFANRTKRGERSECFLNMNHLAEVRALVKIVIASKHPWLNGG